MHTVANTVEWRGPTPVPKDIRAARAASKTSRGKGQGDINFGVVRGILICFAITAPFHQCDAPSLSRHVHLTQQAPKQMSTFPPPISPCKHGLREEEPEKGKVSVSPGFSANGFCFYEWDHSAPLRNCHVLW